MKCPCESGLAYEACCQIFHLNRKLPETAERLMRSRYVAYVFGELDYLYNTTHPSTRKPNLKDAYGATYKSIQWIGLTVLHSFKGRRADKTGKIEFEAAYVHNGERFVHHEKSRFRRHRGEWLYVDGKIRDRSMRWIGLYT